MSGGPMPVSVARKAADRDRGDGTAAGPGASAGRTARLTPRFAGRCVQLALGTLVLSAVALALFFGGAGGIFGPINDVLIALTVVLLVPAIVVARRDLAPDAGAWFGAASLLGIAGIAIMGAGQLLLVAGVISLGASFVTGGLGVLMLMTWLAGLSGLSLRSGRPGRQVGAWGLAFLLAALLTAVLTPVLSMSIPALSVVFGLPLLGTLVGWLVALGRDLQRGPLMASR